MPAWAIAAVKLSVSAIAALEIKLMIDSLEKTHQQDSNFAAFKPVANFA